VCSELARERPRELQPCYSYAGILTVFPLKAGLAARYDGGCEGKVRRIKTVSERDFTEDLKIIDVPALVMHGDDDQIVPRQFSTTFREAA
jgi:pimeloyl-ACP methyl ester carboxylesterase